jgi:predicted transcriptional regulator
MTLRQIAAEFGVDESAIRKRAKSDLWVRDLAGKIAQRSEELVRKELVRKVSPQYSRTSEKEVIEANAQAITRIVLDERKDVIELRTMASGYKAELEASEDDLAKRIGLLKALSETQKTMIALERQVFGIDKDSSESPIDAALKRIAELKNQNGF